MKYQIGHKFGKLTVVEEESNFITEGGYPYLRYKCQCECGNFVFARKSQLKSSRVVSCGCIIRTKDGIIHERHKHYGTQIYQSWFAMKSRCMDTKNAMYKNYGERGISVCDKWLSFAGFFDDMGSSYIKDYSIDRIDNNIGYCKENCRWADDSTQAYNQRMSSKNKSGKTGVSWHKTTKRWRVKFIEPETKVEIVEFYDYLWDAIYSRMELEQKYHGYVKE